MNPTTRSLVAVTAALTVIAGACSSDTAGSPDPGRGGGAVMSLMRAESCESFGDWVRDEALDHVGAYGLDGGTGGLVFEDDIAVAERADSDVAGSPGAPLPATDSAEPAASFADESTTGTNNQEVDVDEADLVKTDGVRVLVANGNRLQVFSLVDGAPYLDAAVDLGDVFASRLFLSGDTAYVLGDGGYYGGGPVPMESTLDDRAVSSSTSDRAVIESGSTVVEVDLADEPTVVDTVTLDGAIVDGRMADGTIRLVVRSSPVDDLGFVHPQSTGAEKAAERTNRQIVQGSDPTDWIPKMVGTDGDIVPMVSCSNLSYPQEFAGFGTISIVTITDGLGSLSATGVTADAETVYASTSALYVATTQWGGFDPSDRNAHVNIHAFSTPGSAPAEYRASGRVEGTLLNQYSLSEHGGYLRVATTARPEFDCPPNADCAEPETDNGVSVLTTDGDVLTQVGRVDRLGVGEEIRSVRFMGDTAYVVTFRQTDPFYVVDLSDPTAPKVTGELKVPGFSSYLHPVGGKLVLGVGSDADDDGRITGAKVSLYDASDPANPIELSNWTDSSWSFMVANDPKAFHFDQTSMQVFLPAFGSGFCDDAGFCAPQDNSVLVFSLAGNTVTLAGTIDHSDRTPSPQPRPEPATDPTTTTTGVPSTTTTTTTESTTSTTSPSTTTTEPGRVPAPTVPGESPIDPVIDSVGVGPDVIGPIEPDLPDDGYSPTITRAFVVDGRLVTVSEQGIATHLVPQLTLVGFAAFG